MKVEYCWQARYTITQQNNEEIKLRFLSREDTDVPWQAKLLALGEDNIPLVASASSSIHTGDDPSYETTDCESTGLLDAGASSQD